MAAGLLVQVGERMDGPLPMSHGERGRAGGAADTDEGLQGRHVGLPRSRSASASVPSGRARSTATRYSPSRPSSAGTEGGAKPPASDGLIHQLAARARGPAALTILCSPFPSGNEIVAVGHKPGARADSGARASRPPSRVWGQRAARASRPRCRSLRAPGACFALRVRLLVEAPGTSNRLKYRRGLLVAFWHRNQKGLNGGCGDND